ncbi:MAG: TonB-dependent receptor domain-containing protein [Haliscomenobacter sp.]
MRTFFVLFFVGSFLQSLVGQVLEVEVRNKGKETLPGATVQLRHYPDTNRQIAGVCDIDGVAQLSGVEPGNWLLRISYVGYQTRNEQIALKAGMKRLSFVLEEESLDLEEVTVTASRPLVRQEDDKTIIDPEPLASLSINTLEVLEKTPGLFVDQDGNIFLNSTTPAVVYINGREQRMGAQDIAAILRSLPPGNIQRIEVLRTPSSKFDAASSGGIVNVVLKKGVKIGRTGSANIGMNQGRYGNQNIGFNLNDSGEKGAYYLSGNASRRDLLEELNSVRYLTQDTTLNQGALSRQPGRQGFIGFGANYDLRPTLNISYDGRVNLNDSEVSSTNINRIQTLERVLLSENDNRIANASSFLSFQHDLGLNLKLDSTGSEWDTKLSYTYNTNENDQDYRTAYSSPLPFEIAGEGTNRQHRRFFLLQSDLTLTLPAAFKIETGFKSTFQSYGSSADYFFLKSQSRVPDPLRTNAFDYRENLHAAYLQASKRMPAGFLLKTGVRMEYTLMDGRQRIPVDTNFLIRRADFFPYVYLSRKVVDIAKYELRAFLIYRRTINRPGYQNLNPYIRYIDQYLYETGNPALQPQFTENIEANISFDERPILAVGRNYTTDIFSNVVYQDAADSRVAVRTVDNVGKNTETYFRVIGAIPPGKKYFFVAGAQYNFNEYEGIYENQPLTFRRGSWRLFTFHQLKLAPQTKLNISGFMLLGGQQNFYELGRFGQLNAGLNQNFLNNKLILTINANDIFRTMRTRFTLAQGSIRSVGDRYSDTQRVGLNLRYQFGINKKARKEEGMPDFEG